MTQSLTFKGRSADGLGSPPDITFTISEDSRTITADPPERSIAIRKVWVNGRVGTLIVSLDADSGQVAHETIALYPEDPLYRARATEAMYACELASALYWSGWRARRLNAAEQTQKEHSDE